MITFFLIDQRVDPILRYNLIIKNPWFLWQDFNTLHSNQNMLLLTLHYLMNFYTLYGSKNLLLERRGWCNQSYQLQASKIVINIRVAEICHQYWCYRKTVWFKNDQIGSVRAILVSIRVILFDQFDILKVHICII